MDDRPQWSKRMVAEREARGWSQLDAIRAMRAHSPKPLPDDTSLLRNWKRWEAGDSTPDAAYQPLIARTFGTVSAAIWPVTRRKRDHESELMSATGMTTLEIITRLRASAVDDATLDGMRITADQLCSDYPHIPAGQLLVEGRAWLHRISSLLEHRLTLGQHRAVLATAGWLALLVGCIEYDTGDRRAAEATRQAALSLGTEAGNGEIEGWAHEMRAWFDLTSGDYQGVITAADQGREVAGHSGVAVQLAAQQAKAWARVGDRRQTEVALDQGRRLLEALPHPANLDHHFVVDPTKFDFYAMDCYRKLGEDRLAVTLADEVIQASTDHDGTERAPMRIAEARITLAVSAARQGDLDQALAYGRRAINGDRKSLPSLRMVARDLTQLLADRYAGDSGTAEYLDQLHAIQAG
jgi:tetratricopeptide (TPR) repeat protein